jgi:signal transduction histidine kinase
VTDLALPDVPRLETVRRIREQAPHIPLVVLTGYADEAAAMAAIDQGAQDYLIKDRVTPEVLDRTIRYAVQRQRNAEYRRLLDQVRGSQQLLGRKNRRLARLNQIARDSVDDISHEFRTPLTVISEYVALMRDGVVGAISDEQSRMLNVVADRADDLNNMVDDMLDVSKLKAGLLGLYRRHCRVQDIVDHVQPSLDRKALLRGAQFNVAIDERLPEVYCDAEKVGRVIVNLVVNAIKFCGNPGLVRLWARNEPHERQVLIGVTDNGPGIDAEQLKGLFRRFHQANNRARGGAKGFGLGLNIAKRLVALNLGQLAIESTVGQGSTFSCTVPWADVQSILPRFIRRLESRRSGPRYVSLVVAATDASADDGSLREFNAFLNCSVRQRDLVVPLDDGRWLILLAARAEKIPAFMEHIETLHHEASRNRPRGPMSPLELHSVGTWSVADSENAILEHVQSLMAEPPRSLPRAIDVPGMHVAGLGAGYLA